MKQQHMQHKLEILAEKIRQADAIIIGGGSGLSSAAGYNHYHWSPAFDERLGAFRDYYGFCSPLEGFYRCYSNYGELWGYYSQYIRFLWEAPTGIPYLNLKKIVNEKPYFVLTTNVDMQFSRIFPDESICRFQGDFQYYQCMQPCHDRIYESRELVMELSEHLIDGIRLPEELVPRCKECGRILIPWVRDDSFLEGKEWKESVAHYHNFLRHWLMEQKNKKVLLLELGVGEMTPSIIKLPFWEMTAKNENVFYACLNKEASHTPEHLNDRSIYLDGDLAEILQRLQELV